MHDGWITDCRAAWASGRYALLAGVQLDGEGYELHLFLLDDGFGLTDHLVVATSDEEPFLTHELAWIHGAFAAVYDVRGEREATMTYFDPRGRVRSIYPFAGKGGFVREVSIAASSPPALAWSESSSNEKKRGRVLGAVMTAPGTVGAPFWVHKRRDARFVVNASGQGDHFAFAWSRDDRRKNGTVHWSMYRLRPDEVGTSRPEVLFSAP